jgi:ankyrin repeat protein
MNWDQDLPYRSTVAEYEAQAAALFAAVSAGDDRALWKFKWEHPRFAASNVEEVRRAELSLADARTTTARRYAFADWDDLLRFAEASGRDGEVRRFEDAVEAVVDGDVAALRAILRDHPELARARSTRMHHATLLHYVAANGVEGGRQRTPPNAVAVATLLLDAGAEPDALADMYDAKCTTMSMLVSSAHPARAGLQAALATTLLDRGAALEGPGTNWQSPVLTALAFGYTKTAAALAGRGVNIDTLPIAAGLGRVDDVRRLLPDADGAARQAALALAAQHGHPEVVALLLDAGEDPNRYNPRGFHAHSTPLHQAVWARHLDVVRLLLDRGARLDIPDTIYNATPLRWAVYGQRTGIEKYLRDRGAE